MSSNKILLNGAWFFTTIDGLLRCDTERCSKKSHKLALQFGNTKISFRWLAHYRNFEKNSQTSTTKRKLILKCLQYKKRKLFLHRKKYKHKYFYRPLNKIVTHTNKQQRLRFTRARVCDWRKGTRSSSISSLCLNKLVANLNEKEMNQSFSNVLAFKKIHLLVHISIS